MRRAIFWLTVASGVAAAYLMFKRGVPLGEIAKDALSNPVGTMVNEVKAAI